MFEYLLAGFVVFCCRILSYPQTDIFLLVFALDSRVSFENIRSKWRPEISRHAPGTPFIIVGTKLDLRAGSSGFVGKDEGEALKSELGALKYVECSALTQIGLKQVFDEALKSVLMKRRSKDQQKRSCSIL